ncbi:hypothetical protein COCSUDRAFT_64410 [Coccomyxa subellipsoidea C-169]|uniref:Response regulatory domain-containing protein n=1 Tax=Coccomyxa subellipsoidea (strain C-169) TaxID=574566 RepID=I0Z6J1_COCSC|nr:hypothetical protein COCSUDRAFT_64410 [Coccomyxa subellipsoidea C-169]EIE26260.1 hypothetical protein COCSUDRAFT_64410 [Coccomyxa subellipsoidea C-169]|eukprot:XP_005650804.1 hypothetical protein COCSUDRAFT_64410 [Coccomyxa subellipsoidea C-169]
MEVLTERTRSFSPHVLLAEDDDLTLRIVEQLLKQCNYRVTVARNGQEALDILQHNDKHCFDLILTDIMMPKVDGMDLVCEVNQRKVWSHLPVIVMSSEQSQEAICKAFTVGAADYLIKPIRKNEVATLWHHIWRKVMAAGTENLEGHAAGWISAKYRHDVLSAASLDAASIPQQCATGTAECDAQRAALPPKKRPRLLHDCGSSAVQTAVMSAMSQPQASVMEASTAAPLEATLKRAESEASDSGASEGGQLRGSSYQEAWAGEAMQVSFVRPHEAPVFGSNAGAARGGWNFLPRILSAPSILAVERLHCAQLDTSTAATSGHKRLCMEDNGCDRREAVCAVSDDSGASEMTGDAAALTDGAASAAAFPLNGCESLGVSSRMVVSVDLEIAPLNLAPWPSTAGPLVVEGPPSSTAGSTDLGQMQARSY